MKHRLTLPAIERMFPDEDTAERFFIKARWLDGILCVHCGSDRLDRYHQSFRCRGCRKLFSTKTGTALHSSNLTYRQWAIAVHLLTNHVKDAPLAELHRNIGVSSITAWRMANLVQKLMEKEKEGK